MCVYVCGKIPKRAQHEPSTAEAGGLGAACMQSGNHRGVWAPGASSFSSCSFSSSSKPSPLWRRSGFWGKIAFSVEKARPALPKDSAVAACASPRGREPRREAPAKGDGADSQAHGHILTPPGSTQLPLEGTLPAAGDPGHARFTEQGSNLLLGIFFTFPSAFLASVLSRRFFL